MGGVSDPGGAYEQVPDRGQRRSLRITCPDELENQLRERLDALGRLPAPNCSTFSRSPTSTAPTRSRLGLSSGRNPRWALARYDTDGTLDSTFGGDGRVTTDISAKRYVSDEATAVAIQPDGRIVVAGSSCCGYRPASDSDFTLARYNDDGTLDSSFGIEGMVTTDLGSIYETISSIAILGDGKIVAVGRSGYDLAVVRYNDDGSLDTSFGSEGKVTTHFGGYSAEAAALAIQADGEIVAAGIWTIGCYPGGHCPSEFALARFNADGSLDTSFGEDGAMTGGFQGLGERCRDPVRRQDCGGGLDRRPFRARPLQH